MDLATLQARLAEAETAQHKLRTGSMEETVEHDGLRVTYTKVSDLDAYISGLRAQITQAGGTNGGLSRRAIQVDL